MTTSELNLIAVVVAIATISDSIIIAGAVFAKGSNGNAPSTTGECYFQDK